MKACRTRDTGHGTLRGQAGLEQMLIAGAGMALVIIVFAFAAGTLFDGMGSTQASQAASLLASEADYAGSLGKGTLRQVMVAFPPGTAYVNVSGHRILVKASVSAGATDYFAYTAHNVTGGIRDPQSVQQVPIRTLDSGVVQVGDLKLACFPSERVFSLGQGGNSSATIAVVDSWVENISGISISQTGNIADMLTYTQPPSTLTPGASGAATMAISVPPGKARGPYEGYIICNSTDGGYDNIRIQINVG